MERIKRALMRQGESEQEAQESVEMILDEAEDIISGNGNFDSIGDMLMSDHCLDPSYEFEVLTALASR